jgi:hypothetical protein
MLPTRARCAIALALSIGEPGWMSSSFAMILC